jgi:hypothetical protein
MTLSHVNLRLLLISFPAVLLPASVDDVNASQCFRSAAAVRQAYPAAWPSWTMRATDHQGLKCWFPATPEAHHRPIKPAPNEDVDTKRKGPDGNLLASASKMSAFAWDFRSLTTSIGPATLPDDQSEISFDERFAAAYASSSFAQPSAAQGMMVRILR